MVTVEVGNVDCSCLQKDLVYFVLIVEVVNNLAVSALCAVHQDGTLATEVIDRATVPVFLRLHRLGS